MQSICFIRRRKIIYESYSILYYFIAYVQREIL